MKSNWSGFIVLFTFSVPIFIGGLYLLIHKSHLRVLNYILVSCMTLSSLLILLGGKASFDTGLTFFNEAITLSFSSTPNRIFSIVILLLWFALRANQETSNHKINRFHGILLCLSLSFGFVAFFSGQFMMRYIALEIVGLMVALTAFESWDDRKAFFRCCGVFVILRLGDIGLWGSILILQKYTRTLDISQMITAATELPLQINAWVLAGFLLAILVKTASFPFIIWLSFVEAKRRTTVYWLSFVLMPALGMYLLYRVLPIIQSQTIFIKLIPIITVSVSIGLMVVHLLKWIRADRNSLFFSLMTGMAIYLSAFLPSKSLAIYLWGILFLRIITLIEPNPKAKRAQHFQTISFGLLNMIVVILILQDQPLSVLLTWTLLTGAVLFWSIMSLSETFIPSQDSPSKDISIQTGQELSDGIWADHFLEQSRTRNLKGIEWFSQRVERNILNNIFPFLCNFSKKVSILEHNLIEKTLNTLWIKSSAFLVSFANVLMNSIEKTLNTLWDKSNSFFVSFSNRAMNSIENSFEIIWGYSKKSMVKISKGTLSEVENSGSKKTISIVQNTMRMLDQQENQSSNKSFRWDLIWIPFLLLMVLLFLLHT